MQLDLQLGPAGAVWVLVSDKKFAFNVPVCNQYRWLVGLQVNDAYSVEKGDTALAFSSRDRVSAEEVRSLCSTAVQLRFSVLRRTLACYVSTTGVQWMETRSPALESDNM